MIGEKALIKNTGEILEVMNYYAIKHMTFTIPISLEETFSKVQEKWTFESKDKEPLKEGGYYTLSDGKKYTDKDLVVGIKNIRNYKFKNILG